VAVETDAIVERYSMGDIVMVVVPMIMVMVVHGSLSYVIIRAPGMTH
jgi:hypothetical protein